MIVPVKVKIAKVFLKTELIFNHRHPAGGFGFSLVRLNSAIGVFGSPARNVANG